ncbi:hypothetical protein ACPD87_17155 [Acinetobacter baumannii]
MTHLNELYLILNKSLKWNKSHLKSHEAFCAFIIVSPHKLTREQIKNICIELENAKGIKKWTLRCESFTKKIISIKHSSATPDEWKNRFKNLFSTLIN